VSLSRRDSGVGSDKSSRNAVGTGEIMYDEARRPPFSRPEGTKRLRGFSLPLKVDARAGFRTSALRDGG